MFNVATKEIKPILGGELDVNFCCLTEVHKVEKHRLISVGSVNLKIMEISLIMNKSATYFETRAVWDYEATR